MPTITQTINKLTKFSDQEGVADIVTKLSNLNLIDNVSSDTIETLRNQLKTMLPKKYLKRDNISLADAAFDGLLALAEFKPINEEDPITQEKISNEDKVVASSGHQFSLTSLIDYHHSRYYRGSSLGETDTSKWLLNPITNLKFDPADVVHIKNVAREKGLTIQSLKPEQSAHTMPATPSIQNFFQPQHQNQSQQSSAVWRLAGNRWEIYDSGSELNRSRMYINDHAIHIHTISLYGYNDDTFSITIVAGHNGPMGWAAPTIEHNQQFIQALQAHGFNTNSEHVLQFPNTDSQYRNVFTIRASASDINQVLAQIFEAVEYLEGPHALDTIRNEITNSFNLPSPPNLNP